MKPLYSDALAQLETFSIDTKASINYKGYPVMDENGEEVLVLIKRLRALAFDCEAYTNNRVALEITAHGTPEKEKNDFIKAVLAQIKNRK